MGAEQWRPDSTFSQNAGFLATGILQAYANQAIAQGELCTLFESGQIRRTDPTLPWDSINVDDSLPTPIQAAAPIVNVTMTGMTVAKATGYPVRLTNLQYAVPIQTSAGIGFVIQSSSGQQSNNFVLVSADNSTVVPYALALQTGNVVILWHVGANLKFAIYTPNGGQVVAPTTVATAVYVAGSVPWHGHCVLGNGNFALSWCTTSGALQAQVFNPTTGATITSTIAVDSSINGGLFGHVVCANGDFLLSCFDGNHSLYKCYRITNTGTVSWGPMSPSTATAIFTQPDGPRMHQSHNRICELSNGNIAWALPKSSSSAYCNIFVLNSSGSTVTQCDFGNQYHDSGCANPISITANGFCCVHGNNNSPNTYASFFDPNGKALQQNVLVDSGADPVPTGSSPTVNHYCGNNGSAIGICRYGNINGNVEVRQMHCDHRGTVLAPPVNHQNSSPSDCPAPTPNCDLDGMTFVFYYSVGQSCPVAATTKVGASSIIGVAQNSAAAGGAVTILSFGYFQLPATQVFGVGQSFDQRNGSVVGCRGTVGGQIAVLFGWV